MSNYRNRQLLDLAHEVNACQFRLPGVCERYSPGGCEPAHSNNIADGKGMGIKAHDFKHVASCHSCHVAYDGGQMFTKEEKRRFFERGWADTIAYYFLNDMIGPK